MLVSWFLERKYYRDMYRKVQDPSKTLLRVFLINLPRLPKRSLKFGKQEVSLINKWQIRHCSQNILEMAFHSC